jgi:hypothetical protein
MGSIGINCDPLLLGTARGILGFSLHPSYTGLHRHPPFGVKVHLTIPPVVALHFLCGHLSMAEMGFTIGGI